MIGALKLTIQGCGTLRSRFFGQQLVFDAEFVGAVDCGDEFEEVRFKVPAVANEYALVVAENAIDTAFRWNLRYDGNPSKRERCCFAPRHTVGRDDPWYWTNEKIARPWLRISRPGNFAG